MRRLLLLAITGTPLLALTACRPSARSADPPAQLTAPAEAAGPEEVILPEALNPDPVAPPEAADPEQATPPEAADPEEPDPERPTPGTATLPEALDPERATERTTPPEAVDPGRILLPEALDPERNGLPQPADPETTASTDNVEIPQAPEPTGVRSVDRYLAFPDLAPPTSNVPDGDQTRVPVDVTTLVEPIQPCSVTLHGLDDANRLMPDDTFHLAMKQGDDDSAKLRISLKETISAVPEGKFFIAEDQLRFRWLRDFSAQERDSLRWFSACIVEVSQRDASQRIALYKQVHLDALPLAPTPTGYSRAATIDLDTSPGKNGVHPVGGFDFLLGHGKLHLGDDRTIAFGKGVLGQRSHDIPELVEQFDLRSASVKLERKPHTPLARQLTVEIVPKWFNTKEILDEKLNRERLLNRLINGYKFDVQRGNADKALDQLKALAQLMQITPTPEPRYADTQDLQPQELKLVAASNAKKRFIYINRLVADVYNPAVKVRGQLVKEIKKLRDTAGSDELEYLQGLEENVGRIQAISVVLYRLVDGKIRTNDVIIGEP